jgi:protein-tyrosine phosphatase
MKRVLFLCTGNYYRSRFAEMLFNWHAEQQALAWRADSRGLALDPANPGPVSRHTLARLNALGVRIDSQLRPPRDLSLSDLAAADHVVAVKAGEHQPLMERRFPDWLERVEFWNIHDVDCSAPEEAMPLLESEVLRLAARLRNSTDSPQTLRFDGVR